MPGGDLVGQITVYYRPPNFDGGHVYVEVRDQRTGENYHLDIGPSQIGLGVLDPDRPYEAVVTGRDRDLDGDGQVDQLDDSRRTEHHSATWQITASQLEGAIQAIGERLNSSTGYHLTGASCVDATREVLEAAGYNLPDRWFPSDFWDDIQRLPETNPEMFTSPGGFDAGVDRHIDIRDAGSPVDSPEHNISISDGEGRYVPPPSSIADPNTLGNEQDSTPSDAPEPNLCDGQDGQERYVPPPSIPDDVTSTDPSGHATPEGSPPAGIPEPNLCDGQDGQERYVPPPSIPDDVTSADPSGYATPEGSPSSYDPSGGEQDSTSSEAMSSDPSGHATPEGSPSSYDPSGGEQDSTSSEAMSSDLSGGYSAYEGNSCEDYSGNDGGDSGSSGDYSGNDGGDSGSSGGYCSE